jgi:hypothetical protein
MAENKRVVEPHGCIVCGKIYNLLVVYSPEGKLVDCTVTDAGGRRVPDPNRPLVACKQHRESEVETALAKHYPGNAQKQDSEDD